MPTLPTQGSVNWYGWATAVESACNVAYAISDGTNISVTGTVATTSSVTGATLATTGAVQATQQSSDPAGVSGSTTLWSRTADGALYTRAGTGTIKRLPMYWGSGTAFPTSGIGYSDTFFRTDVGVNGSLWRYTGSAWRYADAGVLTFATATARDAFTGSYEGLECIVSGVGHFIYSVAQPGWLWFNTWLLLTNGSSSYQYSLTSSYTTLPGMGVNVWCPAGRQMTVEFWGLGHCNGSIAHLQLNISNPGGSGSTAVSGFTIGSAAGADSWQTVNMTGSITASASNFYFCTVTAVLQSGTAADVRALPSHPLSVFMRSRID